MHCNAKKPHMVSASGHDDTDTGAPPQHSVFLDRSMILLYSSQSFVRQCAGTSATVRACVYMW
jgi:hypothetical protein